MQQIESPFGINVFGSAIVRVAPDIAVINFKVSPLAQNPKDAFQAAREAAQTMQSYFISAQINDSGSSQVTLAAAHEHRNNRNEFVGYRATVDFRVVLNDMSRMEEVLVGLVEGGAVDLLTSFQTTRLKEVRATARRQAVAAAKEKAELYCEAAGKYLGELLHIEDINPDTLPRNSGHTDSETLLDDYDQTQAFNPSNITVTAAVLLSYKLSDQKPGRTHLGFASE